MTTPFTTSFFSDVETPVSLFHKVAQNEPQAFLLESTDGDNRLTRYSFIGFSPIRTIQFESGVATVTQPLTGAVETFAFDNPVHVLESIQTTLNETLGISPSTVSATFPFTGGWVGYMGYGATQYFDAIPQQTLDPLAVPDGAYGYYDSALLFDHLFRRITFISFRALPEAKALWASVFQQLQTCDNLQPLFYNSDIGDETVFDAVSTTFSESEFCDLVTQAQSYIHDGEVFQIVLSHRFSTPVSCPSLNIYRVLQAINPSPYAYYLKFPDFEYLGSSPETFVQCLNGTVVLQALAGTSPRGETEAEDILQAEALRANEKELAEHRMLVDLGRNDMGRVCDVGSIDVGEIARLTKYTHVMHLATKISGRLRADKTTYELFQSCFPRGTVSGAPKIRAMKLLSELEPERRGIYSGVVGYFDNLGNMDAAIAIRSALIKNGVAHVNAGAGIVYDSVPVSEYQETRNKAKSVLKAVQMANQLSSSSVSHSVKGNG